jgi:hypothetical protein
MGDSIELIKFELEDRERATGWAWVGTRISRLRVAVGVERVLEIDTLTGIILVSIAVAMEVAEGEVSREEIFDLNSTLNGAMGVD